MEKCLLYSILCSIPHIINVSAILIKKFFQKFPRECEHENCRVSPNGYWILTLLHTFPFYCHFKCYVIVEVAFFIRVKSFSVPRIPRYFSKNSSGPLLPLQHGSERAACVQCVVQTRIYFTYKWLSYSAFTRIFMIFLTVHNIRAAMYSTISSILQH
jgi:hypothetical protein